jgi:hypothetical protein
MSVNYETDSSIRPQLGLGDIEDEFEPRRVLDREMCSEAVVKVEAGYAHTLALTGQNFWTFAPGLPDGLFSNQKS